MASGTRVALTLATRSDLAVCGVGVSLDDDAPLRRRGGAGPTDDGHVRLDGISTAIPVNPASRYQLSGGRLLLDGADLGLDVEPVQRPVFYDLSTADGISYEQLARLHGSDVLATTVVQTCIRYREDQRCRFCAIEASLAAGSTTAVKTPAQLAEVARAAVRLDGVKQMVMTTGTSAGRDRGARHLARCVDAVRQAVPDLPIQVQCEPPADLAVLGELKAAGAVSIGIHVESMDDDVRRRWMPGKSTVPLAAYRDAWTEAVRIFGRNQVSTYLLLGLGESPDDVVAWAVELIALGVYPFVVPYRPVAGTLAHGDGIGAPAAEVVADVTARVAELLHRAGMRGADQGAGCAACGACSTLNAVGA